MRWLMNRTTWWVALPVAALAWLIFAQPEESASADKADEPARGASVLMFGGTPTRNLVNLVEKGILSDFSVKKGAFKNVKWTAKMGNKAYGGPVIAGGRVFVATNNDNPRDPKIRDDKGIIMCFRESDGKFLWQAVHDKLANNKQDNPTEGIASTPTIDGDRIYYVNNRCEVVCADVAGDEATGKAKIVWTYDMIGKLGVYPCQLANCSPLIVGDTIYVITGNGTDTDDNKMPAPKAPSFIALNKKTAELIWKSSLPGPNIMRGQWSNPSAATVNGKTQIIFGGGDGWLYSLEPATGELIWKFDCNPKKATPYRVGGGGEKCFIVATPVVYDNKVYVGIGQEPDTDGPGVGHLWCVDLTKKPANKEKDLSPVNDNFDPKDPVNKDSGLVWHLGGKLAKPTDDREWAFGRTLGTVAIVDDLVYATDVSGFLYCLDAKTGTQYGVYDLQENTWCSPYYVDGKVYVGAPSGDLHILRHGKKVEKLNKIPCGGQLHVPPVACNGVLFINNGRDLIAIAPGK
jgi:outer membrane protein assembly factor BamB